MSDNSLLLISGSLRAGSYNRMLLAEAARLYPGGAVWADIRFPLYDGDAEDADGIPQAVQDLAGQIAAVRAVVISTPEYNKALSGVLKNALDWVSRTKPNPWLDKPVAVMSAAAGREGGARAQFSLRLAMNPFQPRLLSGPEVMVAKPGDVFGEDGRLPDGPYLRNLTSLMDKLAAM